MDIAEIQERVVKFVKQRAKAKNYEITPELSYLHLSEEMGEVARQLVSKKARPESFDENNLKEEIVDVVWNVLLLAHLHNINLNEEINKKIDFLFKKYSGEENGNLV